MLNRNKKRLYTTRKNDCQHGRSKESVSAVNRRRSAGNEGASGIHASVHERWVCAGRSRGRVAAIGLHVAAWTVDVGRLPSTAILIEEESEGESHHVEL